MGSQSPHPLSAKDAKRRMGHPDREGHEFHSCRHGYILDAALAAEVGLRRREPQRLKPARITALIGTTEVVPFPILLAIRAHRAAQREIFTSAQNRDVFPAPGFGVAGQEAPGFAVFFVFTFASTARVEVQARTALERLDRDDVPGVLPHHVRRNEVDAILGVRTSVTSGFRHILSLAMPGRAFHLHPPKSPPRADQYIVWIALSPRFSNAEIEAGSAGNELGLGSFSATLGLGTRGSMEFDNLVGKVLARQRFPAEVLALYQDDRCWVRMWLHNRKGAAGGLRLVTP